MALCPKVKASFGGSAVVVSLVSDVLPNGKKGGGCSAGALGFPKAKPPVAAGAELTSLIVPPKTKPDGAREGVTSFFSSGFLKLNVGAAGSFVGNGPNIKPPCGAGAAGFGSPNLENMDPLVVAAVVVVVAVGFAFDVVSFVVVTLSLFS